MVTRAVVVVSVLLLVLLLLLVPSIRRTTSLKVVELALALTLWRVVVAAAAAGFVVLVAVVACQPFAKRLVIAQKVIARADRAAGHKHIHLVSGTSTERHIETIHIYINGAPECFL